MSEQPTLWGSWPTVSGAVVSKCGRYRHSLLRVWGDGPILYWVMLNPSTADETTDDPTVRKCIGFSKKNGFGSLVIENLVPFRATDPKQLNRLLPLDLLGDRYLADKPFSRIPKDATVVCAWGSYPYTHTNLGKRMLEVLEMLPRPLWCVWESRGRPWHPLYAPYGPLKPWSGS
jgi:hypothetical protein